MKQGRGKGRNCVAVDDFVWTRTQGRLADSPTLGWRTQSPWDCQNGGDPALKRPGYYYHGIAVRRTVNTARSNPRFGIGSDGGVATSV